MTFALDERIYLTRARPHSVGGGCSAKWRKERTGRVLTAASADLAPAAPLSPCTHAHRQRIVAMDRIAGRHSAVDGLYYPTSFLRSTPPPSAPDRKAALLALLFRDSPLFLERYGGVLSHNELAAFDALAADYEVGWHLRRLCAVLAGGSPPASRGAD
ncbi:hypothetical protein E2562_009290 [Oryza meyeriana var. granulata]|uniref:CCD97-like C-terminal domain-containing protein n=1 Tax=Oryza meyeriana var. granulata TaxID=110450 RepID=A0A6G1E9X4_9ORYZ|nr:hypothetical protein E2562_009290 [Oryza meyeriana var. granulata]